jgi:PAS domain S-box-containing protein
MKKDNKAEIESVLRQKAEALLEKKSLKSGSKHSEIDALKLVHELEVYQIELELQNEELFLSKEKAAELATEKYAELYDFAPSGYFTLSNEGRILDINLCGSQMLGKERLRLKNNLFDIFVANDSKPVFHLFVAKVFDSKAKQTCELTLETKDNLPIYVHLNGIINENDENCLVTMVDITEHKHAEQALKYSEENYHILFSNNPQPMWIYDIETLAFLEVNQAAINHYGYSREEFLRMTLIDIRPEEDIPTFLKNIEPSCHAFNLSSEVRHIKKNGELINVEIASQSVVYNGIKAKHVLVNDITEHMRAEVEIRSKNEELQKINAEKDKFFSIIAHDLRNPFNGFLGLTEIMAEKLPQMTLKEIQNIALIMRSSATNLFSLLGNLLEWSRSQRGLTTYIPTTFLLKPKILENALLSHEAANKKKIAINYKIPDSLEVLADVNMLGGIIRNLVSNAVKFSDESGNIIISARVVSNHMIEVFVKDTGIGMTIHMIDNLFRLDVNTCRKGTAGEYSTGLGLIICKDSVEKQGGKLSVESQVGKGSTFSFTLPGKDRKLE